MHCGSARASTITIAKILTAFRVGVTVRPDGSASEVVLLLLLMALLSRLRAFFRHAFRAQNDNTQLAANWTLKLEYSARGDNHDHTRIHATCH